MKQQVAQYWSAPWPVALLGAVERVFALAIHLSASLLVLQCFRRRSLAWLFAAIGWHWLVDALAVYMVGRHGIYWTEAVVGVCALVGVGIILALRDPEKAEGVPLADTSAGGPEP